MKSQIYIFFSLVPFVTPLCNGLMYKGLCTRQRGLCNTLMLSFTLFPYGRDVIYRQSILLTVMTHNIFEYLNQRVFDSGVLNLSYI